MTKIQIELVSAFKGEPVVLVAMDRDGLDVVRESLAFSQAGELPTVVVGAVTIGFSAEPSSSSIDIRPSKVTLQLAPRKIDEIIEKLDAMRASPAPCHHYVDIDAPTGTLVLAKDEYLT